MQVIPIEIRRMIFDYLDSESECIAQVCKAWASCVKRWTPQTMYNSIGNVCLMKYCTQLEEVDLRLSPELTSNRALTFSDDLCAHLVRLTSLRKLSIHAKYLSETKRAFVPNCKKVLKARSNLRSLVITQARTFDFGWFGYNTALMSFNLQMQADAPLSLLGMEELINLEEFQCNQFSGSFEKAEEAMKILQQCQNLKYVGGFTTVFVETFGFPAGKFMIGLDQFHGQFLAEGEDRVHVYNTVATDTDYLRKYSNVAKLSLSTALNRKYRFANGVCSPDILFPLLHTFTRLENLSIHAVPNTWIFAEDSTQMALLTSLQLLEFDHGKQNIRMESQIDLRQLHNVCPALQHLSLRVPLPKTGIDLRCLSNLKSLVICILEDDELCFLPSSLESLTVSGCNDNAIIQLQRYRRLTTLQFNNANYHQSSTCSFGQIHPKLIQVDINSLL